MSASALFGRLDDATVVFDAACEQSVLGCLLLDNRSWDTIADRIVADDFYRRDHQLIFEAIAELAARGEPFDAVLIAESLLRTGLADQTGGLVYLANLVRETASAANVRAYADVVREHATLRRLRAAAERIADGVVTDRRSAADQIADARAALGAIEAEKPNRAERRALEVIARRLCDVVAKPTKVRWLPGLRKILERGVIAVMAGARGAHKSTVVWHWAMTTAGAGEVVVIISPEGSGHDRRAQAWMKIHGGGRDIDEFAIYLIERRIDLNSQEGIAALLEEIQRLGILPTLIVVDTLSKNAGALDTDNNPEVAAYIGRIDLQIRSFFDATVLVVTHTGHADRSRPRGASALEADTDAAYVVQKSEGVVTVSRERFKDAPEMEPLSYCVEVVDLGYVDDDGEAVTSCALLVTDTAPAVMRSELKGKAQRQLLAALRARANGDAGKIWTPEELRRVGRESGLNKATARSAAEAVSLSPYMIPSVGGYRLAD